jgi:hypothetical protein
MSFGKSTTFLVVSGFAIGSLFMTGCKPKKVEGARLGSPRSQQSLSVRNGPC